MDGCNLAILLILVALPGFTAHEDYDLYWLNIDCGATETSEDPIIQMSWFSDDGFIESGENGFIRDDKVFDMYALYTLRYFPKGVRHCYNLPLERKGKYLIRAGFCYGNYDGLSKPPMFDLEINGNILLAVNVSASNNKPLFHEVMLVTSKDNIPVCLVRTRKWQIPFISSIEAAFIHEDVYKFLHSDEVLYLESRINYGPNHGVPERFNRSSDKYNRIWKQEQVPKYVNVSSGIRQAANPTAENYPPYEVIANAIQAHNISESIVLPLRFHQKTQLSAYFILYLAGTYRLQPANETRKVVIYIDGHEKNITEVLGIYDCQVVFIYVVNLTGAAKVTISADKGSTLAPIINAMEVFTVVHVLPPTQVSNADNISQLSLVLLQFLVVLAFFSVN